MAGAAQDTATQTVHMKVEKVAILRVSGDPGTLIVIPPATPGVSPVNSANDSTFIQFTSITGVKKRKITVQWGQDNSAPSGCSLKVEASVPSKCGSAVHGGIILTDSPQDLVVQIGSCATGTGPNEGVRLLYTLSVDDVSKLIAGEERTSTITLTLSDET